MNNLLNFSSIWPSKDDVTTYSNNTITSRPSFFTKKLVSDPEAWNPIVGKFLINLELYTLGVCFNLYNNLINLQTWFGCAGSLKP